MTTRKARAKAKADSCGNDRQKNECKGNGQSQGKDKSKSAQSAETGRFCWGQLDGCAYAAELLHDGDFFFVDALDAVAHGLLAETDVADEAADAVGFE